MILMIFTNIMTFIILTKNIAHSGFTINRGLLHERIFLFKRSCRPCGKDRMHKNHSGKLAFQDDFCAFCLHCFAMETL